MINPNPKALKNFMARLTVEVGTFVKLKFGNCGAISSKLYPNDILTSVDEEANQRLIKSIEQNFPSHGVISEEIDPINPNSEFQWIFDPLDGTLNYSHKIPIYALIVALQVKQEVVISCIYEPDTGTLFHAETGKGAFSNRRRIHASKHHEIANSKGLTTDNLKLSRMDFLQRLYNTNQGDQIRASAIGSIGISAMQVACGNYDWLYSNGNGGIWDHAGPVHLLREAGCKVTDISGNEWEFGMGPYITANPELHEKLLALYK